MRSVDPIEGEGGAHLELGEEVGADVEVAPGVGRLEAGEQLRHLHQLRIHRRRPLELLCSVLAFSLSLPGIRGSGDRQEEALRAGLGWAYIWTYWYGRGGR